MAQKSTPISLRDAREGDREAAREVTLAAYVEYAKMIPPLVWEGYRKNIVESLDGKGPAQHIVAESAGQIVGSVLLYPPAASAMGRLLTRVQLCQRCGCWQYIRRCADRGLERR